MIRTRNQIVQQVTAKYLDTLDMDAVPTPEQVESELLEMTQQEFALENNLLDGEDKKNGFKRPQVLFNEQIAMLLAKLYHTKNIVTSDTTADASFDLLGFYASEGESKGLYVTSEMEIDRLIALYNPSIDTHNMKEVSAILKRISPRRECCKDPDLIAVNNGIFDYREKTLSPFDKDLIFLSKSKVDYNPNAVNVTIHNDEDGTDWDVESWVNDLSDDPEITNLLWEIMSAIIRPNVRWNKSAWLFSETGNNGKGTLCELMRNLCGPGSYASIPLSDFSHEFMLEPLTTISAIIVDENDVGQYIDKLANLKAVITNDVIQINRKYRTPISCRFRGFMVQCLNEFPRIRDRSNSVYRRQLFVPMTKCFTGRERGYIKTDYLHRPEVLEYVLYRVLNTDFYKLSEPKACRNVLDEYKEYNDTIRQFWNDVSEEFKWDLLPFTFLYALYKAWFAENAPSGTVQNRNMFIIDLLAIIKEDDTWICLDKNKKNWTGQKMAKSEPLIAQYNLTEWMNPGTQKTNKEQLCHPPVQGSYRGILRRTDEINAALKA
ncbi:MAG: hypothetical protein HDQ88_07620 [Clostridia bacterium]|nr:hypothetical protein [Clostridia bacterium]